MYARVAAPALPRAFRVHDLARASLVRTFADAPGVTEAVGTDQKVARIRELTDEAGNEPLNLYADPLLRIWKEPASARFEEVVAWPDQLVRMLDLDAEERAYKLEIASKVAAQRCSRGTANGSLPERGVRRQQEQSHVLACARSIPGLV